MARARRIRLGGLNGTRPVSYNFYMAEAPDREHAGADDAPETTHDEQLMQKLDDAIDAMNEKDIARDLQDIIDEF